MFETVLVAGRGEIAVRIIETCRRLGVKTVAVHSEADRRALPVRMADESVLLGAAPASESYLDVRRILEAAAVSSAEAVHPGDGFLAENAEAARAVQAAGKVWIGPEPDAIEAMADKNLGRERAAAVGLPVAPGQAVTDLAAAIAAGEALGYPLMLKSAAGGGGIGLTVVTDAAHLRSEFGPAAERAQRFFGRPDLLLERYLPRVRHIEVQLLGLGDGRVVSLGERDCSGQRRYRKIAEEAPAPGLDEAQVRALSRAARTLGEALDYRGAGTVEFLLDPDTREFVFCEMNTRLQAEHPVTELVTGIDLVEQQLRIAAGEPPSFDPDEIGRHGHAIEVRVYAEDPQEFAPGAGRIRRWQMPSGDGVRVDAGYAKGDTVSRFYDPLMVKIAAWAEDRAGAVQRLHNALAECSIDGPPSNLSFLQELTQDPQFVAGTYDTGIVTRLRPAGRTNPNG
ncbi:MAG TPA: biotin carboxylase N-terminal domain-containing protein [Mycobacteriales bacterium]|nr:biotin carboxylase N-terminal domain-containing protein [Mycobacteriales bacterium]